jgi:hypothetical protein
MGAPDRFAIKNGITNRITTYTNLVPLNYIRIVDPSVKKLTVELDVLLRASLVKNDKTINVIHRSFSYVGENSWKDLDRK